MLFIIISLTMKSTQACTIEKIPGKIMVKPSQELILLVRTTNVTACRGKLLCSMGNDRDFVPQTLGDWEYNRVFTLSTHDNLPRVSCPQNCRITEWFELEVVLFNTPVQTEPPTVS